MRIGHGQSLRPCRRRQTSRMRNAWLLLVILLTSSCVVKGGGTAVRSNFHPPFIGTLQTSPVQAAAESLNGIRVAMIELEWADYEPAAGQFNTAYETRMKSEFAALRSAGMRITLSLGFHYTPVWLKDSAGSRFTDQNGKTSNEVDFTFNESNRVLAERYVRRVASAFPMTDVWAVRISSAGRGELLYPPGDTYWAYGADAQYGTGAPASIARNPVPGWKPGDRSISTADVRRFYQWYVAALADTATWQINLLGELGFTGFFQILTPGIGVQPAALEAAVADYLPPGLAGQGVAWLDIYRNLPHTRAVMAYVTSVGDGSGGDHGCDSNDGSVPLTSTVVSSWSATRWISRIAGAFGLYKAGENPGYPTDPAGQAHYSDTSRDGLLARALNQAKTCHFIGFYWAHDSRLHDGTLAIGDLYHHTSPAASPPPTALFGQR